jgi:hypothetical protein
LDLISQYWSTDYTSPTNLVDDIKDKIASAVGDKFGITEGETKTVKQLLEDVAKDEGKLDKIKLSSDAITNAINTKSIPDSTADVSTIKGDVSTISSMLSNILKDDKGNNKSYKTLVSDFKKNFFSGMTNESGALKVTKIDYSEKLKEANAKLQSIKTHLASVVGAMTIMKKLEGSAKQTNAVMTHVGSYSSSVGWTKDGMFYQIGTGQNALYYDSSGVTDTGKGINIAKGTNYYTKAQLDQAGYTGYSSGIENGPVTYTGLAMLHGSPSSPEYVLNSD